MKLLHGLHVDQILANHQTEANLMLQGKRQGAPVAVLAQVKGGAGTDGAAIGQGLVPLGGVVALEAEQLVGQPQAAEQRLAMGMAMVGESETGTGAQGLAIHPIGSWLGQERVILVGEQLKGQAGEVKDEPAMIRMTGQFFAEAAQPGVRDPLLQKLQGSATVEVALAATDPGATRGIGQQVGHVGGNLQAQRAVAREPVALVQRALPLQQVSIPEEGPDAGAFAQQQAETDGAGLSLAADRAGIAVQALGDLAPGSEPAEMVKSDQALGAGQGNLAGMG